MKTNTKIIGLTLLLLFFVCLAYSFAETVTVVGQGNNRTMALEDAKRRAVEQGVGALIDSKTQVANFTVLQDKIYSRASGYVTNYNILSEGKTPDGSLYTVTIQANVKTADIKNDLRAIGILMTQVGNPRFITLYVPESKVSMHRDSDVVLSAERAVNSVFAQKGFIVLDKMFIDNIYNEIEKAGRIDIDMEDLAAIALKYNADLLLVFDVKAAEKVGGQSKYFGGIQIDMNLKAAAPATADLIAQRSGDLYVKTMKSMGGDYYRDREAARGSESVGKALSEAIIGDTLNYFERAVNAGTRFDVWFRNFPEREIYTIVDVIEGMKAFKDKNVRQQVEGLFQLDVNYQGKKFDFQRELFQGLEQKGIKFKTQQAKGNRFLFFKEGTDNPYGDINIR
ncbi:MAG: hypothetical protein HQK76_10480 [Desulfobacterales bacterium]|nr:hypothetical protein [Desulfobacterales bacterium]